MDLSADADVTINEASDAVVQVDARMQPVVKIERDLDVDLSLRSNADSTVMVAESGADLRIDMAHNPELDMKRGGCVEVHSNTNPDILIHGHNKEHGQGDGRGSTVEMSLKTSPRIIVNGDNAHVSVHSTIQPKITIG